MLFSTAPLDLLLDTVAPLVHRFDKMELRRKHEDPGTGERCGDGADDHDEAVRETGDRREQQRANPSNHECDAKRQDNVRNGNIRCGEDIDDYLI